VVVQLLESNVILETFGNAETVRSYNSSRFGKYVEVMIADGDVVGSTITSYLLEKGRVVSQAKNERSFHAFYQV
jgi:myosin heavy subunit